MDLVSLCAACGYGKIKKDKRVSCGKDMVVVVLDSCGAERVKYGKLGAAPVTPPTPKLVILPSNGCELEGYDRV